MKGSVYMRWAKEHAWARFNLANSGMLRCETSDLEIAPDDLLDCLLINGPNSDGYPPLLAAIAARYGVAPEQVVTAAGTSGANCLAFAALVEPGDTVLVEQPTYEPLLAALHLFGARIERLPRRFADGFRLDLEAARAAFSGRSDRVRLVVLTSPHNPSGVALEAEEAAEIGRLAARVGAHVLVDEVYRDSWFEEAPPSWVHAGPHFLATSSLTKTHGLSGLRCGWVLAAPAVADRVRRTRDAMEAVGPIASEALAVAAFRQIDRLEARSRAILEPNQRLVAAFLAAHADRLDAVLPRRSMIVFPRLKNEPDSGPLHDWLRGRETSIVPGRFFEAPQHFRLGFAVATADVEEGLRRLAAGLRR